MATSKLRKRTPYNLPPAWSPGMAMPENVVDEGLERRALVTMQQPDGTFDNPAVGTGGYVVPQYVVREGYGRGTYTTAWAPRGTYFGPGLPDWLNYPVAAVQSAIRKPGGVVQYDMESLHGMGSYEALGATAIDYGVTTPGAPAALADGRLPGPYQQYGDRAATILLQHAASHPPAQRKAALQKVMNKIDTSLYTRSAEIAKRYERAGAPPAVALHQGISRAMGVGLLSEIVKTGQRGAVNGRGQLGLGSYTRTRVGASRGVTALGALTLSSSVAQQAANVRPPAPQMLQVGPFSVPVDADTWIMPLPDALKPSIGAQIVNAWQHQAAKPSVYGTMMQTFPSLVPSTDLGFNAPPLTSRVPNGLSPDEIGKIKLSGNVFTGKVNMADLAEPNRVPLNLIWDTNASSAVQARPLYRATHPVNGKLYGLYLMGQPTILGGGYGGRPNIRADKDSVGNPTYLRIGGPARIYWAPIPVGVSNWLSDALQWVVELEVKIVAAVGDVVDAIGGLVCDVLNSAAAPAGAAVAAAVAGVPPKAGVAGAQIAQNVSGCKPKPSGQMLPSTFPWLLVAGGAAALGAVLLLTSKKGS